MFPFPLRLPCASLVPCQAAMFQVPRKSGLSPSCTVRRPQVTSASCLCRQAYGPCLISSFRLAPFAFESPVPAQHGLTTALGSAQFLLWSPCRPLTAMNSALADYLSSEEETGPLGETITGGSILLPPELVFEGDALGCLTCYASSDEDPADKGPSAASAAQAPEPAGATARSDPTDEQAVRQLISAEISRTQAAESLERVLMAREDPVRVALEMIQAERRAAHAPVAPFTRTKVIPAVKPMPRVGVKAMPRIPHPASRTFPKGAQHGYCYVSGPSPDSWTRTPTRTRSGRVPPPQPAAVPAAPRVLGHGRPLTAFFPYPAKALPAAMTPPTTLSAPSQPPPPMPAPVPKSSSSRTARDRRAHAPHRR